VTARNLRAITWDGAFYSVMVGAGERWFQAFAVALGHGDLVSGLVATLPVLGGAVVQLISPWAVLHVGSQKRWVVGLCLLGSVMFAPLAAGAWAGTLSPLVLFGVVTVYWAAGLAAASPWVSWVETLVPARARERFFGRRQAVCQASLFVAFVACGALLHGARGTPRELPTYMVLFVIAGVARLISTGFVMTQTEPVPIPQDARATHVLEFLRRLRLDPGLRVLFAVVPLQFAVQMAEPYFTPWTLNHLRASYGTYLVLVAAGFLGRIAVLPAAGTLARRFGARRLLWAGAMGLVPVAALWSVSSNFVWLASVQLVAGVAWGAMELGAFLVYFEAVPHRDRVSAITALTLIQFGAIAAGSVAGGWILETLGGDTGAYVGLFAASTLVRMVASRALAPLRRTHA